MRAEDHSWEQLGLFIGVNHGWRLRIISVTNPSWKVAGQFIKIPVDRHTVIWRLRARLSQPCSSIHGLTLWRLRRFAGNTASALQPIDEGTALGLVT
jgi:hypothetical protein